jgi:hypothetical protein
MPIHIRPVLPVGVLIASCFATAVPVRAQSPHCGTTAWMNQRPASKGMKAQSLKQAAGGKPVRTFETAHFAIHYVLKGINRVKTVAADSVLVRKADSLFSLPANLAEAAVYAKLDSIGAPQASYILAVAGYLENARAYYVDTLKMLDPPFNGPSNYYGTSTSPSNRYSVDVADVGTAEPQYRDSQIYALTYPQGYGGMLLENDFLYLSELQSDGIPGGRPIQSIFKGKVIHDYSVDWDAGLKVTCFHEFYHSVQFAYTPDPIFHIWYETSATGMEERKAPEVNDYLQYVPYLFNSLKTVGMFNYPANDLPTYGNGIYHVFLTQELGVDFDVHVWSRLASNGNRISEALDKTYSDFGKTPQDVYARFGAQLAFSGTDAKMPMTPFSPDIPLWPQLPHDSVDLRQAAPYRTAKLPPMSMQLLKLSSVNGTGKALILQDTVLKPVVVTLAGDTGGVGFPASRTVSLETLGEAGRATYLLMTNGTKDRTASGEIRTQKSRRDVVVYAYPNPLDLKRGIGELDFSSIDNASTVRIYSESGALLRQLAFKPEEPLWSWDLKDADGNAVKPGIYYYGADGGSLKTLSIR